ncbi:hypothetical protein DOY81_012809 [Sarcophaga bullata]|nr:hypothetical protein DOY81_012809 [Sarcophaga bullata]
MIYKNEIEHYKDMYLINIENRCHGKRNISSSERRYVGEKMKVLWTVNLVRCALKYIACKYAINRLKRTQEKLIGDLDHGVMHREQIFVSASIKQCVDLKPAHIKQYSNTVQYKINDLRNKLKHFQNDITLLSDQQIVEANREYLTVQDDIKSLRHEIAQEESQDNYACRH